MSYQPPSQGWTQYQPGQQYQPPPQGWQQPPPIYSQSLPYQQYQPPPQMPYQPSPPPRKKWYQGNAGIIAMLILFFPVGLYLMWKYAAWPKAAKWIVTSVLIFFVGINAVVSGQASGTTNTVQQPETPTATPKPLTIQQRIAAIVKDNGGTDNVSAYVEAQKAAGATFTLSEQWDAASTRDAIEIKCFDVQKAFWTAQPSLGLESALVVLNGPLVDAYGNQSTGQIGSCTLKKSTAAKFAWDNLTWKSAWNVYDDTSLLPSLQNA